MGTGMNYVKRPTILDALVRAGKLLSHTRDIIKNEKVFDPGHDFQKRLLMRIYDMALDVNSKAYVANELRVEVNPRIAAERLMLQAHAIASCECLLGLIADARVAFGLDTCKFWNWARMAKDTLTRLRAWHESDRRRYGELAAKCGLEDFPASGDVGGNGSRLVSFPSGGHGASAVGESQQLL